MNYKKMGLELRGYLDFTDHKYMQFAAKKGQSLPDPPPYKHAGPPQPFVHNATPVPSVPVRFCTAAEEILELTRASARVPTIESAKATRKAVLPSKRRATSRWAKGWRR